MGDCAAMQSPSQFWKLQDFFFTNQRKLNVSNVENEVMTFLAGDPKIDAAAFRDCVDEHRSRELVTRDLELGVLNGVHATPTFFVDGVKYEGNWRIAQLNAMIDAALRGDVLPQKVTHVTADPDYTSRISRGYSPDGSGTSGR
jgi:protein-disulfide isomerase